VCLPVKVHRRLSSVPWNLVYKSVHSLWSIGELFYCEHNRWSVLSSVPQGPKNLPLRQKSAYSSKIFGKGLRWKRFRGKKVVLLLPSPSRIVLLVSMHLWVVSAPIVGCAPSPFRLSSSVLRLLLLGLTSRKGATPESSGLGSHRCSNSGEWTSPYRTSR
jgi:hypothetical protein